MINILFAAHPDRWDEYQAPLTKALNEAGLIFDMRTEFSPEQVDYIVYAPNSALQNFTPYTNCRAVLNLWAGVENIVGNQTLRMPLARMIDRGMTRGMVEWVTGHVMRHHLGMDSHIFGQDGQWRSEIAPLACDRPVTILGMGTLGQACAEALTNLEFPVTGWSRTPKSLPGITALSGEAQLEKSLESAQIVILLLPLTAETQGVINTQRLAALPKGAVLINAGRGPLIDDAALLACLDADHLGHATLDVFDIEPLPVEHVFWQHPKITVTPHIASATRPTSSSKVIAENIRRGEAGEALLHLVDRHTGY
ncbi:glyoxylate/hydroxypyruvate reductase A [Paracoccaceae bacterium]|nr:glyoxylate/hydroxypyruvate reductase A [Paracoccaceae bacterium]